MASKKTTTQLTPTETVTAIREWRAQHGRLPTEQDWARARDGHPSAETVARRFGSWKGALAAAGHPVEPGHRPSSSTPAR